MQRQLLKFALTGLFALGIMFASQSTGKAQWWGGYYSSYYGPSYYNTYYSPWYSGWYGYSSYYGPSYSGWYSAGYSPSSYCGCSTCGCDPCGCSSCCGVGCSSCGAGGCSGGACGYACAPDNPDGVKGPTPEKGSGYEGVRPEDKDWKGTEKPPAPGPGADNELLPGRKTQDVQKVPGDVTVPQKQDEQKQNASPADQSQEEPPKPNDQKPADNEKKAEGPIFRFQRPATADRKSRNEYTKRVVQNLRGLDGKITSSSTPERTRVKVYAGEGRVVIARRVVHPSSDWDVSTTTRLVQK